MSGTDIGRLAAPPVRLRQYVWALVGFWTVAVGIVLTWRLLDVRSHAVNIARSEAAGAWKKEVAVYRWAAAIGRVYVPVTKDSRPDDNLAYLPERDISTPSGRKLTLISPPMIMNRVHVLAREQSGVQGHLTSLRPIRPEHSPDPWEKLALTEFAQGRHEVSSEETINGHRYLRFMRPLMIDASCLTCHSEQGYKVGDIRGGLSISVPMATIWDEQMPDAVDRIVGYGGMWILGLIGITIMSRRLRQQISRCYEAEQALQEANDRLEQRVVERTAELAKANHDLEGEIAERKKAEQWLLESEQRFRGYFEQGLVGMAILSARMDWEEVNDRLCKMLGYAEEELLLKTWHDLTHPDDLPAEEAHFQRLKGRTVPRFIIDIRLLRKDGRPFQAGLSAEAMKKPDGTIDCILILVQDESVRRQV